jgi:hypothetical protein
MSAYPRRTSPTWAVNYSPKTPRVKNPQERVLNSQASIPCQRPIPECPGSNQQVEPMVERMKANLGGVSPRRMALGNGYYSDENAGFSRERGLMPTLR